MCQKRDFFQSSKMQSCTRTLIHYVNLSGFQIQTLCFPCSQYNTAVRSCPASSNDSELLHFCKTTEVDSAGGELSQEERKIILLRSSGFSK